MTKWSNIIVREFETEYKHLILKYIKMGLTEWEIRVIMHEINMRRLDGIIRNERQTQMEHVAEYGNKFQRKICRRILKKKRK